MSKKKEKKKSFIKGKMNAWMKDCESGEELYGRWKKRMYHFAKTQENKTKD